MPTDGGVPTDTPTEPTDLPPAPEVGGFLAGEFCLVRTIFEVSCTTGCHSATVAGGGLDLQTDPHTALVNRPSAGSTELLVNPGLPIESFLYRKVANLLANEGDVMPPQGALGAIPAAVISDWIANGAINDCDLQPPGGEPPPPPPPPTPPPTPEDPNATPVPHHPPGWTAGDQHGVAMNLQSGGDCRSCHGAQLDGGTANQGCDTCHNAWQTNCTFCHGGDLNASGAPPKDIDGETDPNLISFTSHTAHVDFGYGCSQCHYSPTSILTNGHVFGDITPGYGELDYTQGISPVATYFGGTCSNVYCHGGGRLPDGEITDGVGPLGCTSCHPNANSDPADWAAMSGRHRLHLEEDPTITCSNCHANTVDAANTVIGTTHVNGTKDVASADITVGNTNCTGACHGYNHNNSGW